MTGASPETDPRRNVSGLFGPPSAVIARVFAILCIASGFIVGIEGLADPSSIWLPTALGLLVTGLVAQSYALYAMARRRRSLGSGQPCGGGTAGGDEGRKEGR